MVWKGVILLMFVMLGLMFFFVSMWIGGIFGIGFFYNDFFFVVFFGNFFFGIYIVFFGYIGVKIGFFIYFFVCYFFGVKGLWFFLLLLGGI